MHIFFGNGYFHLKRHFRYIFVFFITQKQTALAKKVSLYKRTKTKTANLLLLLLLYLWVTYTLYFKILFLYSFVTFTSLCHFVLLLLYSACEDDSDVPYKQQCLGKDTNMGGKRLELMSIVNNKFAHCVLHNTVFYSFFFFFFANRVLLLPLESAQW